MRGHRLLRSSMMAFSTLNSSFGSLLMTHSRIATSSPKVERSVKPSVEGICFSDNCSFQATRASSRYETTNAPR